MKNVWKSIWDECGVFDDMGDDGVGGTTLPHLH